MNIIFRGVPWLCLLGLMLLTTRVDAQEETRDAEAQRLVHILSYVAADYGGAVENGAIKSQDEYNEQVSFLVEGEKIAARLQPGMPPNLGGVDVDAEMKRAQKLVADKATEAEVAAVVTGIRNYLIQALRLEVAPSKTPSFERGQSIYLEHCATCHGEKGGADTARAASLLPHPVSFLDPAVGDAMTPYRAASTIRFGVPGTSMIPFTFLTDADRWDLAYYVTGLRHTATPAEIGRAQTSLVHLAVHSDAQLRDELRAQGGREEDLPGMLANLRRRAPYDDQGRGNTLGIARLKLDGARAALARGERDAARGLLIDAYLEGVEPAEGALRTADPALVSSIEARFMAARGALASGAAAPEVDGKISEILGDVTRADTLLARNEERSFSSVAIASGGILLREGVEAALLVAALLGIAAQAGMRDKRRYIHLGWAAALVLGGLTWLVSSRLIVISGARRELIEGVTALLATAVLFYVSYSLLAKREVARWMKFLKEQISSRKAALSLFAIALLAAYREAFETVLFYQALLASNASPSAAGFGAAVGAALLVALVFVYTRAGRFAPPQIFFRISSYLLYGLAVVFAGQGIAALQIVGVMPIHPFSFPSVPAIGLFPTLETCGAQLVLIGLALLALPSSRSAPKEDPKRAAPTPPKAEEPKRAADA
jgi:high-affinity iron transporter